MIKEYLRETEVLRHMVVDRVIRYGLERKLVRDVVSKLSPETLLPIYYAKDSELFKVTFASLCHEVVLGDPCLGPLIQDVDVPSRRDHAEGGPGEPDQPQN